MMKEVTISDRAQALMVLDTEAQRIEYEIENLRMKLSLHQTRLHVIKKAMISIHKDGLYEIETL